MKKNIIILLLVAAAEICAAPKPRFFITTKAEGDSSGKLAAAYLPYFETQIFNLIKDIYPCAVQTSLSTVSALLSHERTRQLLGSGSDASLTDIAQSMGCDYLISLKVSVIQNQAMINALCMDSKKARAMARAFAAVQHGGAALDAMNKVSKDLFDDLKEDEICPFKGTINVKITGKKKENQEDRYPVHCNQMDGAYEKKYSLDMYSENEWIIEKTARNAATGTVKLNIFEEEITDETNFCHECENGKQAARTYYEKTTTYLVLEGLSRESESYGEKVDDARVTLTFLDNGKYTMRVKAASNKGVKKTVKEVRAQGGCDNINEKPDPVENQVDHALNEIFGEFTGNAQDKTLAQKDTIKRTNPISGEEEEISYEFNLTRD